MSFDPSGGGSGGVGGGGGMDRTRPTDPEQQR
jgi:hypothetical protein